MESGQLTGHKRNWDQTRVWLSGTPAFWSREDRDLCWLRLLQSVFPSVSQRGLSSSHLAHASSSPALLSSSLCHEPAARSSECLNLTPGERIEVQNTCTGKMNHILSSALSSLERHKPKNLCISWGFLWLCSFDSDLSSWLCSLKFFITQGLAATLRTSSAHLDF